VRDRIEGTDRRRALRRLARDPGVIRDSVDAELDDPASHESRGKEAYRRDGRSGAAREPASAP
jgi:hypothetical protein